MSTAARKERKWWHIRAAQQLQLDPTSDAWAEIEREYRFTKAPKVPSKPRGERH